MNTRPRHFLPGIAGASQPMKSLTPTPLNAQPGNGPIAGLTDFFSLNLVNFDWVTWHDYEWENWVAVDALLNAAIGFLSIRGIWRPNTAYTAGDTVFDPADTTLLYTAHTNHTSSTDFNIDKPLYWDLKQAATPPVQSVFGRIGAVVATAGDYDAFYYTQAQVDASQAAQDALISQNATDITSINTNLGANYYTKAEVDAAQAVQDSAIAQNASDIAQNVSDIAANAAAIAAVSGDLSANYYTKTEQDATDAAQDANITQNASDITANANAISALATDLANNYYTIAQQDVTDAAQDTAITDNANAITALNTSLGNYYTKTESDAKFFNYAGAWAAGTYDPSQVVTHNDGTWLCLVQTTDEPTSLSADWLALGSAGAGTLTEIVEANTTEGWQVWGDVLIQWGAIAATDPPAGLGLIRYPQPFKAGSLPRVSATTIEDTGGYGVNVTTISATNTGCPVRCYDLAGNRINANVQWVAVGEAPDNLKKPKTVQTIGGSALQEFHDPTGVASWKITGNTLECWGSAIGSGHRAVSFPKTFKRSPTVVASVDNATEQVDTTVFSTSVYARTTTGFGCKAQYSNAGSVGGTSADVSWHAIGEWDGIS